MLPLKQKTAPSLYASIVILTAMVFIADIYAPLGVAVWIIYFVPIVLSFFTWRPLIPVALAGVVTVLLIVGRVVGHYEMDLEVARFNRLFDILTAWVMAIAGYLFIRGKLAVKRQEWLQTGQVRLSEKMAGDLQLEQLG